MPINCRQLRSHRIEVNGELPAIQICSREDRHPDAAESDITPALSAELICGHIRGLVVLDLVEC